MVQIDEERWLTYNSRMHVDFLDTHIPSGEMVGIINEYLPHMKQVAKSHVPLAYLRSLPVTRRNLNKTFTLLPTSPPQKPATFEPEITFIGSLDDSTEMGIPSQVHQGLALSEGDRPFVTEKGNRLHAFTYGIRNEIFDNEDAPLYQQTEHFIIYGSPEGLDNKEHRYALTIISEAKPTFGEETGEVLDIVSNSIKKVEGKHDLGTEFMTPAVVEDFLKTVDRIVRNAENQPEIKAFMHSHSSAQEPAS